MKKMLALVVLLLGTGAIHAKEQPEDCRLRAEGKTGAERVRVVAACIRHNASISQMPPRLALLTECNRLAGDMSGKERVKFVDDCMNAP